MIGGSIPFQLATNLYCEKLQWSLPLNGGSTARGVAVAVPAGDAAMEPPVDGGSVKTTWWGTGMEQQPQWGPPVSGGSTGLVDRPGEVERLAAMEPAAE